MSAEPMPEVLAEHDRRVRGMLADPECVGELLLVGLVLARAVDLDDPAFRNNMLGLGAIADLVYGNSWYLVDMASPRRVRVDSHPRRRVIDVVRSDVRRYQPPDDYGRVRCGRPMPNRENGRCGREPHHMHIFRLTDPATGERQHVAACSYPAHKRWLVELREENKRQLASMRPPVPAANTGGVLARHLPEIDWEALYRHIDTDWVPPPESGPRLAPKLVLLTKEETEEEDRLGEEEDPAPARRPALRVLPGGWQ